VGGSCLSGSLLLGVAGLFYWRTQSVATVSQDAQAIPVSETIDLSQAGTTRGGETSSASAINLPRRIINAHVILPYYSPGGNYAVSVTTDRDDSTLSKLARARAFCARD